jgi:myo-inositol-1(or 4)-monophosphatase
VDEAREYRRILVRIAGEAAGLLRDLSCSEEYTSRVSGETIRADLESESYIIDALKSEGLGGRVVTEERGTVSLGGEGPIFIVDPLDGSTNYGECIPWSSVSIAVAPPGATSLREVEAGAIAPVFWGPPMSFARGEGCYVGGERVEPRRPASNLIFVYVEHPEAAMGLARVTKELGGLKVRSLGSAALELAYTSLGRARLFLDLRSRLRNVDVAAAMGMLLECGGSIVGGRGEPLDSGLGGVERVGTVIASLDEASIRRVLDILGGSYP